MVTMVLEPDSADREPDAAAGPWRRQPAGAGGGPQNSASPSNAISPRPIFI